MKDRLERPEMTKQPSKSYNNPETGWNDCCKAWQAYFEQEKAEWGIEKKRLKNNLSFMKNEIDKKFDILIDTIYSKSKVKELESKVKQLEEEKATQKVSVEELARFITMWSEEKYYGKAFAFNFMVDSLAKAIHDKLYKGNK